MNIQEDERQSGSHQDARWCIPVNGEFDGRSVERIGAHFHRGTLELETGIDREKQQVFADLYAIGSAACFQEFCPLSILVAELLREEVNRHVQRQKGDILIDIVSQSEPEKIDLSDLADLCRREEAAGDLETKREPDGYLRDDQRRRGNIKPSRNL